MLIKLKKMIIVNIVYQLAISETRTFYYCRLKGNSKILKILFPFYILKACFKLVVIIITSIIYGNLRKWPLFTPEVDLNVTEKCNLNCDGCSYLIPRYTNPENKSPNQVFEDLNVYLNAIDYVGVIKVLGGEPFLNRDLSVLIDKICSNKKISCKFNELLIITNGTVIPDQKTLHTLKNNRNKVHISISNYGDKSKRVVEKLKENDLIFLKEPASSWYDIGNLENKNHDMKTLKNFYLKCGMNKLCNSILNGIFYLCPVQAHGSALKLFNWGGGGVRRIC
ncbi:MAG: radical SAM protein [Methanobrevibacter sp.]|nr:radical SAM protein [Candidatus Methanovirga aequatorialis]